MGNLVGKVTPDVVALMAATLVATYIIALRKQDESMRMKERKLSALFECGTRFTSAGDLDQLLNHVLDTAVSETGSSGGRVVLVDPSNGELHEAARRRSDPAGTVEDQTDDFGVERCVVDSGQAVMLMTGSADEAGRIPGTPERPTICVPLVERTSQAGISRRAGDVKIVGALTVFSEVTGAVFGQEDLDLLRTLAIHASMGVVNANLYGELRETFLKVLQSLARSLEARDPYTQGHSFRVSEISSIVAAELGLPPHVIEIIKNAALLHDIGKIGVPDSVLQKPSKLTPEERLIIHTHPTMGENICRPLDLGQEALFLIRHHQERLNGTGYPDQLPADQQPLPLRIICAVDSLDAMSSDRPYRKALSAAQRVEQMNRGAGSEFDPVVVEVLKSLLSAGVLDRFYTSTDDDLPMAA
jgi:putative nucleotidyltransferase with HDIG domain